MQCRCSDIAKYEAELSSLRSDISSDINHAKSKSPDIVTALQSAAGNIGEAVNTSTISLVETALGELFNKGEEGIQSLSDECIGEIERMTLLLEEIRSEDEDYHRALAAKAAEAAAKAAREAKEAAAKAARA